MNKLSGYDFNIGADKITKEALEKFLKTHCKHWVFQKEKGEETGYLHWQVRISLGVGRTLNQLIQLGKSENISEWHLSPTSLENRLPNNSFYVTKPETRQEGPWSSEDTEPTYVPRQIRDITLYEWQEYIKNDAVIWDTRHINVVLEKVGNKGKTILSTYLGVHKVGRTLPPVNDYKDLMRMVMDMPTSSLYVIDMPRSIPQKNLAGLFAGLEELKGGHAWDDRYRYQEKWFDCPNIWVFTNTMPDMGYLSKDRWVLWKINDDGTITKRQREDE
nr:MAG: replication associated protein [Cressdnaviricota sp.]